MGFAVYDKIERLSKPCAFAEDLERTSCMSLPLVSIRSGMSNGHVDVAFQVLVSSGGCFGDMGCGTLFVSVVPVQLASVPLIGALSSRGVASRQATGQQRMQLRIGIGIQTCRQELVADG